MLRIVEFAVESDPNKFSPCIIMLDCSEIVGFEQIFGANDKCKLTTKQNKTYTVYGTYRTLTNRFLYAINKKHSLHEDYIIRPTINVIYKPETLEPDVSFFDKTQLKGFIFGIDPNFDINKLTEYTKEVLELY